ncbi:uncharacterized protein LOC127969237 isoform X1 [Carassius gibelio]|uniref:uncharacterized protein LOC127969237 isoform X1 n=1 Tax=Carassius gibelio TaxID=101364 RepID=UPI002279C210|nr:uncharacterized protein LOC127969237 isoform X1 [Carassius gibelio]
MQYRGSQGPAGLHIHTYHQKEVRCVSSIVSRAWRRYRETGHYTRRAGQACRRATASTASHRLSQSELLGMEYLYSQIGKNLTPVPQKPEEEDRLVEEVDDKNLQDEGFKEGSQGQGGEQRQHLAPAPSVLSQPFDTGSSLSDEAQGAVIGPDNITWWDKVQELAGYLVGLREAPYLNDLQVTEAIQLWTALPHIDKQQVNYQPQLTHGNLKAPKPSKVTPGVESVKRCLIGHPGSPALLQSTICLVEAICMKLCALHKSPTKKAGVCTPRWSKILSDYLHIRELVLNSHRLMDETTIQLFELNQRTLIQWFQQRQKNKEMSVLTQVLNLPDRIDVADMQVPPSRKKMDETSSTSGPKHQFILPTNQEWRAPLLRPGRQPPAIAPALTASGVVQPISAPGSLLGTLVLNPDMTVSIVIPSFGASRFNAGPVPPAPVSAAPVSRYTQRNRRRRALEKESGVYKRKYVRGVTFNMCSKCGQPKTKEFGHSRYGNATFCLHASNGKSLDDWLAEQRRQNKCQPPPPQ